MSQVYYHHNDYFYSIKNISLLMLCWSLLTSRDKHQHFHNPLYTEWYTECGFSRASGSHYIWPWVRFPVTTSIFRLSSFSLMIILKYSHIIVLNYVMIYVIDKWRWRIRDKRKWIEKREREQWWEWDKWRWRMRDRDNEGFQREPGSGEKTQVKIDWETQKKREGRQMNEGKWEIVIEEWSSTIQFLSVSWKTFWIGINSSLS